MDLPLHMEKRHLAFYREVSLVLRGDDIQRTKVIFRISFFNDMTCD